MGVDEATVYNWENHRTQPDFRLIPAITRFLGYAPDILPAKTIGEKLRAARFLSGISQKEFAGLLKVDPSTLAKWEQGKSEPRGSYLAMVNAFLNHGRQSRRPQAVFPRPGRQAGDTRLLR